MTLSSSILHAMLEETGSQAILIHPFLPATSEKITQQLGVKPGTLKDAVFRPWTGTPKKGPHLFEKVS